MTQVPQSFLDDEDGAVTVDWVVLTAAVVGMSAIHFFMVEDASTGLLDAASGAVASQNDF